MLGVDSNASQAALVNFEDGVESGPASAPALIHSDVMGDVPGIREVETRRIGF
jgi:hypothetical protein